MAAAKPGRDRYTEGRHTALPVFRLTYICGMFQKKMGWNTCHD